jgi:hypothetical protein
MDQLWQILLRVTGDEEVPLECEDCAVLLETLAELLADGYPTDEVLPVADKVLRRCPDCQEEYRRTLAELALARQRQEQPGEMNPAHFTK